ncbi:hypothetical protein LTR36_005770 [Oleoguttula mirabilis]|uniref:Saccharopine dehydrogenase NADP binding domain-containing protein n=1 Tax=Oleoguttula mirabilis TaxID=1507867 RepID=A0AAV9JD69_9PEZI|nr:hypothetical protein LTR36_005770 [Oleoguttula mirabilis]
MGSLLVYGATGYTGRLIAENAVAQEVSVILGGRNEQRLKSLASALGTQYRVFGLDDATAMDAALTDVAVVLNCAGPFKHTSLPLMEAAVRTHTHYLDVAAELDSYQLAEKLDAAAKAAGVLLLPGCGGSVAMLGCLAFHALQRATQPKSIRVALQVAGPISRGSAISAAAGVTSDLLYRKDGTLQPATPDGLRDFDFGKGPVSCFPVTLPDLITIYHATQVPNIKTYVHVAGEDAFPSGDLADLPDGPTAAQREANRYHAAVEVIGEDGCSVHAVLDTVNGYTFTALAAVEAARRVMGGEVRGGFQTPVGLFGVGFVETIADSRIVDL